MMARCIKVITRAMAQVFSFSSKPKTHPHPPVFIPLIAEAWTSIGTNRVRALLAMLGIIIGVGSVVLMVAIGSGSQQKVEKAINSLGNNLLIILPGAKPQKGFRVNPQSPVFKENDINNIAQLPSIENVAYSTNRASPKVYSGTDVIEGNLTGVDPEFFPIRNWVFEEGDNFSAEDIRLNKRVVIIGKTIADKFFPDGNALGQTLNMGESKLGFLIIGVLQSKGAGLDGHDQDDGVYIPPTTFKTYFAPYIPSVIQVIFVKIIPTADMDDATEDVKQALRDTQKTPPTVSENFTVYNLVAITKVASDTTAAFSLLLGAIASISLLVGSIGIMNIMLVTVSERTREIGIRKAIGATKQQIMRQFLLEAIMISTVGSVVGLALGLGGGFAAQYWFGIPVAFSTSIVVMSLVMAGGIGVASGLYPARKAANMQPIEALRTV